MPVGQQSRDVHVHHSSYVPMYGAITNTNIDPSLLQATQGAHSSAAAQHFSFSPGSQANFSIQHNAGNGALHQPSYQAPVEFGTEAEKQAFDEFEKEVTNVDSDDEGDSSSKEDLAEKLAVVANSPRNFSPYPGLRQQQPSQMLCDAAQLQSISPSSYQGLSSYQGQQPATTTKDSFLPPAYPSHLQQSSTPMPNTLSLPAFYSSCQQQPMYKNTPFAPNVLPQHDAPSHAANPQTFEHVFAASTGGQSGGNIQRSQETVAQTPTALPPVKKRQRSKISDSSDASCGKSSGVATPKVKRAKTKKSDEPIDLSPTNFGQGVLTNMSNEDAEDHFKKRTPMVFDNEDDDIDDVMAHREHWIRAIMSAFDKPYSPTPTLQSFKHHVENFGPWQEKQYQEAMKEISKDKTGKLVEAVATVVYSRVVRSHQANGLEQGCQSLICNRSLKCSARLEKCIEAIEKLAIIRHDVVKNRRIVELVANPGHLMKRKEDNKFNAEGRKVEVDTYGPKARNARQSETSIESSSASEVSTSHSDEDEELATDADDSDAQSVSS